MIFPAPPTDDGLTEPTEPAPTEPAADALIGLAEAAALARVSSSTIDRWRRRRLLRTYRCGARVLVRRDEVEQLATPQLEPTAERFEAP